MYNGKWDDLDGKLLELGKIDIDDSIMITNIL